MSLVKRWEYIQVEEAFAWTEVGILPVLEVEPSRLGSKSKSKETFTTKHRDAGSWLSALQLGRLRRLTSESFNWNIGPALHDDLFAPPIVATLGFSTCLTSGAGKKEAQPSNEKLWLQLLPIWAERTGGHSVQDSAVKWHEVDIGNYRVYSTASDVSDCAASSRMRHQGLASSRSALFARSANYMGSKATLAPQLLDIIDAMEAPGTMMVDLMCGSGAMAGALARHYPTIASDAQEFCRLLGRVQGGGMTSARGASIGERVVEHARDRYRKLSDQVLATIDEEGLLINSELSGSISDSLLERFRLREVEWDRQNLGGAAAVNLAHSQGNLLFHLYGGVYFGYRQAAELDCIRQSIAILEDDFEREWALGALVCAASACAYTYGGHFAQPKVKMSELEGARANIASALQQRSLSVTHEFFSRLYSLSAESESVTNRVSLTAGPWQSALDAVAEQSKRTGDRVCVYVDPPYTRDEYSRYYHVLEAVVRYKPQAVFGRGRLPHRGTQGRFASSFSSRTAEGVEREIASVIQACLENGWNCLWSYSSSGNVSIPSTLAYLEGYARGVDIFQMDHIYKAQGKQSAKKVIEYAIHLRSR